MFTIRKVGTESKLRTFLLGKPEWTWHTGPKPMMFKSRTIPEALLPRIAAAEQIPVDWLIIEEDISEEVFGAGILEEAAQ